MAERALDAYEAKLQNAGTDLKTKGTILTDIRDQIESWCQQPTYAPFLQKFIPILLDILSGPPVFTSNTAEQICRQRALEIIHRLPLTPAELPFLEPYAEKVVDMCLELVKVENEDNAVLCLKIVMDFCRYHAKVPAIAEKAQPFLDLILEIFDGMEQTIKDTFDSPGPVAGSTVGAPSTPNTTGTPGSPVTSHSSSLGPPDPGAEHQQARQLVRGMHSFKVVAECPIIVVSIFQAHRTLAPKNVGKFTPRIKNTLQLQAEPQKRAHEEAKEQGEVFTGVAKEIKAKDRAGAFGDLVTAQVKTMSFLAYLLRAYQNSLSEFLEILPELTVRLLQDVPRAHTATRKELLVAIRHIINFNFRSIFLPVILPLLDPQTLVGDSLTADVTLRPLAYTMLADLIHHVREQLQPDQISRVVTVYVGHLTGDDGVEVPGTSYQTMSAKLLLNMAECMSKIEDKREARFLMMTVLNGIADKFAAMNRAYPNAVKLTLQQQEAGSSIDAVPENYLADQNSKPDWDETDIFNAMPIKAVNPRDRATDPVTENKFLFKNLLHGLKTFFYQLRNSNPVKIKDEMDEANAPVNWKELSFGFEAEEVEVLIKLFREGTKCFQYYSELPDDHEGAEPRDTTEPTSSPTWKEEKDLLETFATIFHHLDPATFYEIFSSGSPSGITFLFEQNLKHPALQHISQFLLASEATSPAFCGVLLKFLMSQLEDVGKDNSTRTAVLLKLFKLSFMSVTLFSQQNESVLLPHVKELITRCIELAVTADVPTNYYFLLRNLFRSIGGGRFEHLYKEILPLLEMMLEVLNTQLAAAPEGSQRDLFVELSLTVPARLTHLLPHLSYLMRPLTVALKSGERSDLLNDPNLAAERRDNAKASSGGNTVASSHELTSQGLRTLELCVDNLTADYLDPIMHPYMDDIMGSLWKMLKPASLTNVNVSPMGVHGLAGMGHQNAHTAVRILGKLGGRNRKFIQGPPDVEFKPYADDAPSFDVRLIGSVAANGERAMPAQLGIDTAINKLWEVPRTDVQKKNDGHYKRQAFKLITSHAKALIGFDSLPDDLARLVRLQANDLADRKFDAGTDLFNASLPSKSVLKKDAQQQTLLKLVKAIIFATSVDKLKDDAEKFLQGLYRHFMLIETSAALARERHQRAPFDPRGRDGPIYIDTSILAHAICESLASEVREVRDAAEKAMTSCMAVARIIFGSEDKAEHLPFFAKLAEVFVYACYEEEWFTKSSGPLGLSILINKDKMALSDAWIAERLSEMERGLLYVVKDMPQDLPATVRVHSKDTLIALVTRFGRSGLAKKEDLETKDSKVTILASRLTAELSHINKHVREAAQQSLRELAKVLSIPIHELVNPVKEPLIAPIFIKPLRALPFPAQIGYVDAINFLMDMEHDVLPFNDELNRLLYEALALVDAEDESLAAKPYEFRTAESIVRLRVAGLRLLTTAIRFPGFSATTPGQSGGQQSGQHRARVISIFFKSLYSKNKEVSAAANAGLKIVLAATQKLPKDLLQNGLRPILMNVQDHRKLSVEGLEGLRTLLQLLTNYFKVEIGTRLLDHMTHIADATMLQKCSFGLIDTQQKMKIVTAIFSVFHLLPAAAAQFLSNLVERVLNLESALRRTKNSPFRQPLVKYLNHYPNETWTYFSASLNDEVKGRFFAQILYEPESTALRQKIVDEAEAFEEIFTAEGTDTEKAQAAVNALHMADAICSFSETGKQLTGNEKLRTALVEAAKSVHANQTLPANLRLAAMQSQEHVMHMMTVYFEEHKDDIDTMFSVFDSCMDGDIQACPSLYAYLYKKVITSNDVEHRRSIITRCIDVYTAKQTSQKMKWFVFHNVMNPILASDVMRNWDMLFQANSKGTALFDKPIAEAFHNKLWKPQSTPDILDDSGQGVDHSRMELLQASAFLIKYHHIMFQDMRKDLIKFAWNYIRLEDHINKYGAYCLIAYFIVHYETPPKIAIQIYNQLLRAHQAEGKNLVMQSLEILEPVLKKRLGGPDGRNSAWARWPRKLLSEEFSNVQQLTSIYHFLVRHPDLFYEAREPFAQIIIQTISKVAQLPSPSVESRKLALNLFSLIWKWEERTVREKGSLNEPTDGDSTQQEKQGAVVNANLRLVLIKYMVQFIATLPERYPVTPPKEKDGNQPGMPMQHPTETITKALDLLHKLLSAPYWDDLDIDAMFPKVTEHILCSDHKPEEKIDVWLNRVINTIQILKVLLVSRSHEWIIRRLPQLMKLLAKPLRSDSIEIQEALHNAEQSEDMLRQPPILKSILDAIPAKLPDDELPDADSPTEEFVTFLSTIANDVLSNTGYLPGVNILWIMSQRRPEDIDAHIPAILRILQTKLAKDHLNHQVILSNTQAAAANGVAIPKPEEVEMTTNLIVKVVDMLSSRMGALGESRRPYLSVLASLVERSNNNALCETILRQVEVWVFNSTEPVPTLKEKTAVLQKMLLFEHRQDQTLYTKFMDLVIRIYEDQKIVRSELAVRMEHAFLIGLRSPDIEMRARFTTIYDKSLSRSTSNRFFKLICDQQWDVLADGFWLSQVIQLMFGSFDQNTLLRLHHDDYTCMPASKAYNTYNGDPRLDDVMVEDNFEAMIASERLFMSDVGNVRTRDVLTPMTDLQHTDWDLARNIWVAYFPMCWSTLSRDDREDIEDGLITLLTKDYHQRQADRRPNCVSALLEGIARARPTCKFPPHAMKYLAKMYDAWYVAATSMEDFALKPAIDIPTLRESNLDALTEIYAALEESDLFYGTWRRRAQYVETNAALSYEQNGIWDKAQTMYEQAQVKTRTGSLAFQQSEYMIWEDHWVLCAQKLQQWEILGDFAKHENINDLYLEATWRQFEVWSNNETREHLDSIVKAASDAPTPRRMFFQAFISLLKLHNKQETLPDFSRICDDNIQLSIKNWHKLPRVITGAHIGLLENFQQLVELHDASVICQSLQATNAGNLDLKSQELKVLLSTWRDRLPNLWDDINAWQDLVTWRQHIFQLINNTYLNLLPNTGGANATGNSYAYRGYHETAWIINRFAHVARKHQMPDVCITQLSKIYTLPNIEIQEAFLKLREQAKCHYQNRSELTSGLDVINNTNLNYFGLVQKAEFYTLKGMFLSKLNQKHEAQDAFGTALFFDIKLPKAWAEWGRYNDYLFKEDPTNIELAGNSLSCYLEAAGQYKSAKSRKLLSRILWILSLDDAEGTLAKTFNEFKGDQPWWYWITFVPQLINNLSRTEGEAQIAHQILANLAKTYPQALHFNLRTSNEDMQVIRKSQMQKEQREKQQRARQSGEGVKQESPTRPDSAGGPSRPGTANGDTSQPMEGVESTPKREPGEESKAEEPPRPKKPWEYTEAIMVTLRTAFPLLYASMEAMVEQMTKHLKSSPEEDAFRLIVALMNDALSYVARSPHSWAHDSKLPAQTEANVVRFAESMVPARFKTAFEAEFVTQKPTMLEYIRKLRVWRDRLIEKLDVRPGSFHLSETTHLSGFRFVWYDEVEVPGQYLLHKDKNQDFVRIERFLPVVDIVRGVASVGRRLRIRGHDGSVHPFMVQHPSPRNTRREERIVQLFRIFNSTLSKKKESRRRNLQFHLPLMIPLASNMRLISDDASYISPQGIWEDYCRRNESDKDEPTIFLMDRLRALTPQKNDQQSLNVRLESLRHIQENIVPKDVVSKYFAATHNAYDSYWLFRKQFSYQLAALTYMTWTMHMTQRYPSKMSISRRNGNIWGSELVPFFSQNRPQFSNPEPVPFRLTPNLSVLMGPIFTEGIFTCALMAIARCLTSDSTYTSTANPASATSNGAPANGMLEGTNCELEHHLSIFIRDEISFWFTSAHRTGHKETELRENVQRNADAVVNKALAIAREPAAGNLPANQSVLDLVARATNPEKLCQTDVNFAPWL